MIGFSGENAVVMPFGGLDGVRRGCRAVIANAASQVRPSPAWLGRVVNAMGEPIDGKGPLVQGASPMPYRNSPPPAHSRKRVGPPLDLGVRGLNTFLTCCRGQRLGIFAGSGVGKSVLLSMLARNVDAAISVIGLIGERGREVQEFLQEDLGEEGLARSVVVVATSDEPALMRRQAAYLTLAIAEYFRDEDQDVLCLMDSVTRFAMAQREIGLSAGEPPTAKGYTPTVFTELPKLLERAGPGTGDGTITAIFTVLVDGDDHNEPIADAVRGILDGHIVMQRAIAERGRYPAVNILKSVSRISRTAAPRRAMSWSAQTARPPAYAGSCCRRPAGSRRTSSPSTASSRSTTTTGRQFQPPSCAGRHRCSARVAAFCSRMPSSTATPRTIYWPTRIFPRSNGRHS